jgi:glycosyltransferase involved in cell wall biosynthesis
MRIMLLNQYAGAPSLGMEYRPHWLATELQKLGHEVLIVAGDFSHLRHAQPRMGRSTIEGVDFFVLKTPRYDRNDPRRLANILAFRIQLQRRARLLRSWRPDVVVASSTHPMDVRPGLGIARGAGAAFVHEVHDLWPLTPRLLGGMGRHHPMILWMQREEDLACSSADLVVSMLPATLPYLQSRGLDASRWVHVSNGVPLSSVGAATIRPEPGSKFRLGYFGGHALSNDLGTLLEAARLLEQEPLEVHLTGSGPLKHQLQHESRELGNVFFHDYLPLPEARRRMREMDALVILAQSSPLYEYGFSPNKAFDYMAAGRPVIQAVEAVGSPIALAGCGRLCGGGDAPALAEAVRDLLRMEPGDRDAMGLRGRDYVLREATHAVLAEKFVDAIAARL